MNKPNANLKLWSLALLMLFMAIGAQAAILPAERQILQKAGINANDYDEGRFVLDDNGHITKVYLNGVGLSKLPLALMELPYVEVVDLYDNQIAGDIGALTEAYKATNPTLSEHLTILNIDNNQLTGDIGPLVELLDGVSTIENLYVRKNRIGDISLFPQNEEFKVWLDEQRFSDLTIDFNPDTQTGADLMALLPQTALYDPWSRELMEYDDMYCYSNDTHMMSISWAGDKFQVWTNRDLRLYDGMAFTANCHNAKGFNVRVHFSMGDVNFSGTIDDADLNETFMYISYGNDAWGFNYSAADLNGDSNVDMLDVTKLLSMVDGTTPTASTPGQNKLIIGDLLFNSGTKQIPVSIDCANKVTAIQFDLLVPIGVSMWHYISEGADGCEHDMNNLGDQDGLRCYRITLYTREGTPLLATGKGELLKLELQRNDDIAVATFPFQVRNVVFSTADSRNVYTSAQLGTIDFNMDADDQEWNILKRANLMTLNDEGQQVPFWDFSGGPSSVNRLEGVTFEDGHITRLELNGRNLVGPFPFVLTELPYLTVLNIYNNQLSGDIGQQAETYAKTSPVVGANLTEIDFEHCEFTGNIGPMVALYPNINELDARANHLTDITPLPDRVFYLYVTDQRLDNFSIDLNPTNISINQFLSQLPDIVRYDRVKNALSNNIHIVCYRDSRNVFDVETTSDGKFSFWTNGTFYNQDEVFQAKSDGHQYKLCYHYTMGDADFNGTVNEGDMQKLAKIVSENDFEGWDRINPSASDLNNDKKVNVIDIVLLINQILNQTISSTQTQTRNEITLPDHAFWAETIEIPIQIDNTESIVALQFDLRVPQFVDVYSQGLADERKADHIYSVNHIRTENGERIYRVMIYSPTNKPLNGSTGTVAMLRMGRPEKVDIIYGEMSMENVVLSTVDGRNVLTAAKGGTLDFTSLPHLSVQASKTTVTEGESFTLTISTDEVNEQALPITIQSEDNHRFDFKTQTAIPAGQAQVQVEVKTLEDDLPQLDQSNLFTVSAPDHNNGEVLVLLKDNDVPELSLTFDVSEANELDGDGAVTATLKRTKKTNNKITVQISDDAGGRLTYAQNTIEMAKNVDEVTFHLGPVDNDDEDGDKTYHVTAAIYVASCDCAVGGESAGFVQATLKVLDDDGPNGHQPTRKLGDAVVNALTSDLSEVEVGGAAVLSVTVKNQGTDVLPATNVSIYNERTGEREATLRTTGALAVGASETLKRKVYLTNVGQQLFYAVVNETEEVSELRYTNNESQKLTVKVLSPWTATITTDKKVYMQKDTVRINGQLTGKDIANASVDVYMINEGCREVATVVSDANGAFYFNWVPYEYQSGHFVLGACYPGEDTKVAMASIDIYGLRRADRSQISNMITIGEVCKGNIMLQNPGVLPLTGVKAEIVSVPGNCKAEVSIPETIEADGEVPLQFSLLASSPSPEKKWEQAKVLVTSKEGARLSMTLYYYAQYAQAALVAVNGDIYTTMTKGQPREYPFVITNNGKGSTGKMTLSLPSCIKSPMGNTLSALAPGDTTTIILNFVPVEGMQLNVPYKGMFAVTPEQGNGLSMNYSVTPVSNEKGTLVVDVTDELTYYTDEAPHVAGAEVVLRNPVTEALVAQGKTDENGRFSITLPEGYYQLNVTADKHNSYQNNILVDPGMTNEKEVCLTYQSVTVTWEVVETEVEDEYMVVSTLDFETRVPEPVVQLNTVPQRIGIDHLAQGESLIYHNILTNKGLITAQDVCLYLPDDDVYFKWEPLAEYEHFDLAAQQSVVIPVRVTRVGGPTAGDAASSPRRASGMSMPCNINERVKLEWPCGDDMHAASVSVCLYYKGECGDGSGGGFGWGDFPTGDGPGGSSFGGESGGITLGGSCNLCLLKIIGVFGDCFMGVFSKALPGLGCLLSMITCGSQLADGEISADDIADCGLGAAGCLLEAFCMECKLANALLSLVQCIRSAKDLNECMNSGSANGNSGSGSIGGAPGPNGSGSGGTSGDSGNSGDSGDSGKSRVGAPRRASVMPSFQEDYMQVMDMLLQVTEASMNQWHEFFGDSIWFNNITQEQFRNTMNIITRQPAGSAFTDEQFAQWKPAEVSNAQLTRFVERLNNTRRFEQTGERSENMMDMDNIQRQRNIVNDVEFIAIGRGYESAKEMFQGETDRFIERVNDEGPGVCATIKLQITQHMTLTRQAFRGTLTIQNGSENTDMEDIKLRLKVMSSNGEMATAKEFEMHVEKLEGFEGEADFDSGWSLVKGETGTATIIFIPTKYAAPLRPIDYSFGGTLSYTDPVSGTRITRELFPTTLTVKPSPELDLTYFMQRDVWGDDPLTEDVVEPMIPAEFTVLINNKGYGDATNVRMVTEQPKIIENEKGLYIDFEILSSQLNGEDKVMAMGQSVATEFGDIAAHSQKWATWELQSTLLGHFVTYNIEATHVTSFGNPDLSLLDQVTIHELIHGFTPPSVSSGFAAGRAFLVNDVLDADDTPDAVYFTDATRADVYKAAKMTAEKAESEHEYLVKVVPAREGWTYSSVEDPYNGRHTLSKIVRMSDQQELPLDNIWLTDRTLRDAGAPHYENLIHFIGDVKAEGESYLLTFEPAPDLELAVEKYPDLPDEEGVITEPLKTLTVRFNKPIDASTFTVEDMKLCHEGVPLDISQMSITKVSDTDFRLDLSGLTEKTGYYVLTVQTVNIIDTEGFNGYLGKQATWIQFLGDIEAIRPPKVLNEESVRRAYSPVHYNIGGRPVGIRSRGLHVFKGKKHVVR